MDIRGADELARLAKALKDAGEKDLQRELFRGINRATKPIKADARASALDTLPSRGGYAARVAKGKFVTQRRTGARVAGVRVVAKKTDRRVDQGILRHPVFGNRNSWVTQHVPPGWWTRPTEAGGPVAREEILKAMEAVTAKIERAA